jgi:hypothetical protein
MPAAEYCFFCRPDEAMKAPPYPGTAGVPPAFFIPLPTLPHAGEGREGEVTRMRDARGPREGTAGGP